MTEGVWIATKPCGCVVGVCKESGQEPVGHNDTVKLEWLNDGLIVFFATRQAWETTYLPIFLAECPHELQPEAVTEDR